MDTKKELLRVIDNLIDDNPETKDIRQQENKEILEKIFQYKSHNIFKQTENKWK